MGDVLDVVQKMGAAGGVVFFILYVLALRKLDAKDKQHYELTVAGLKAMNDTANVLATISAQLRRKRRR